MLKKVAAPVVGALLLATNASAALLTEGDVTLDTADVGLIAVAIVSGLAVMWGLRKVVKTMNRS